VLAGAGKKVAGERFDDLPLGGVGVLGLVDQDVIEAAVELVADPVGQLGAVEQFGGLADLVVEIDQALALLGLVPGDGEGAAEF